MQKRHFLTLILIVALPLFSSAQLLKAEEVSNKPGNFKFAFLTTKKESTCFILSDTTGKVIWTKSITVKKGYNNPVFISHKLAAGTYTARIPGIFSTTIIKR